MVLSKPDAFTTPRLQSMARLAAYALLIEFLLTTVLGSLPFSADPERLFGLVTGLLDIASLPVLAVVLAYAGFVSVQRPAGWEWWLARAARPMLALVALLFVLMLPGVWWLGHRIQAAGDSALRLQAKQAIVSLQDVRRQVQQAPDSAALLQIVEQQPLLRPSLSTSDSPFRNAVTLAEQRSRTEMLLNQISSTIKEQTQLRRAGASGELRKQQLRLSVMALVHALFFVLAWLIWPSALSVRSPRELATPHLDADAS